MVGRDSDTVDPAVLPTRQRGSHSALQFAQDLRARNRLSSARSPHRGAGALSSSFVLNGSSTVTVVPTPGREMTWNVPPYARTRSRMPTTPR